MIYIDECNNFFFLRIKRDRLCKYSGITLLHDIFQINFDTRKCFISLSTDDDDDDEDRDIVCDLWQLYV